MAMRDHPIREHSLPEINLLQETSTLLQEALRTKSHSTISRLRKLLREISDRISFESVSNPLEKLNPVESLSISDLPKSGGIYLFSSERGQYLGLTESFRIRFHIPLYGHLTNRNNSRSKLIIDSGKWREHWDVYFLEAYTVEESNSESTSINLSRDEIFWYYLLRKHPDFHFVNRESNIGMTSEHSGYPVISFCIETRQYAIYPSLGAGRRTTGVNSGNLLRHVIRDTTGKYGYPRTLKTEPKIDPPLNFVFRFATDAESKLLNEGEFEYQSFLGKIRQEDTDCDLVQLGKGGDKYARLVWNIGEFTSEIDRRLAPYRRGAYEMDNPKSRFTHGISWNSRDKQWQVKALTGPNYTDQENRYAGDDELQAAIYRERRIVEKGWQEFNTEELGYPSNAREINALLPEEEHLPIW